MAMAGEGTSLLFAGNKASLSREIYELYAIAATCSPQPDSAQAVLIGNMATVAGDAGVEGAFEVSDLKVMLERQWDLFRRFYRTLSTDGKDFAMSLLRKDVFPLGNSSIGRLGQDAEQSYAIDDTLWEKITKALFPSSQGEEPVRARVVELPEYPALGEPGFVGPVQPMPAPGEPGFVGPVQPKYPVYQPSRGAPDFVVPVFGECPTGYEFRAATNSCVKPVSPVTQAPFYRYPLSPDPAQTAAAVKQLTTPVPGKTAPQQFWGKDLLNIVNSLFGGWSEIEKINMQKQLVAAQRQGKGISFTPQQKSAVDKYLVWGGIGLAGLAVAGFLVWFLTKKGE